MSNEEFLNMIKKEIVEGNKNEAERLAQQAIAEKTSN